MSKFRPYVIAGCIAAVGLLAANGAAVAATGNPLILGHGNAAHKITTVKRTTVGPVVKLTAKPGSAPLAVNSSVKVGDLNADLVDGKSASDLQNTVYRYGVPSFAATSAKSISFPSLPPGIYLASYSVTASMASPATAMDCAFLRSGGSYEIASRATNTGTYASISGSGVIDSRTASYTFQCFGGSNFTYFNSQPNYSSVTFAKVDSVVGQAALGRAVAPRASATR